MAGSDSDRLHEAPEEVRAPQQLAAPVPAPLAPVARLAGQVGNRAMGRAISRMRDGEGILADGSVHPDVEAAIAAHRGGGSPLPRQLAERFSGSLGGSLHDVRVHTGTSADALARAVSARAFATGTDIFFAHGEYRPGTAGGDELIAHEVAHTEQQRGAPVAGPMTVSQPGDPLEREADHVARGLVG